MHYQYKELASRKVMEVAQRRTAKLKKKKTQLGKDRTIDDG